MKNKTDSPAEETPHRETLRQKRKISRFSSLVIIVLLIAAGFGAGALLIQMRLRSAQDAWNRQKTGLEATISSQAAELSAAKAHELLWRLSDGLSTVFIDLTERNFGLAHDEMTVISSDLQNASTGLDAPAKARLDPLVPLMADIVKDADALSPNAKTETQAARKLLHDLLLAP